MGSVVAKHQDSMLGALDTYETNKMRVELGADRVVKVFKKRSGHRARYKREKQALQIMTGVKAVPGIVGHNDAIPQLETTRLPGRNVQHLTVEMLQQLRTIVDEMLDRGIARHSLPIRDLVVDDQGTVGLVDFERVTFRRFEWGLIWMIAKGITRFHLLWLYDSHQPDALSAKQRRIFAAGMKIRNSFTVFRKARSAIRKRWRKKST